MVNIMALVNGKILKGDDCPYKNICDFMITACNGEGCPFLFKDNHFCEFSCGASRFYALMEKSEKSEKNKYKSK